MKIVFVSSGLSAEYGGPAISESSLVHALLKNHQVEVLCEEKRIDPYFANSVGLPRVIEFSTLDTCIANFSDPHWMSRLIREADCVHLNGHWRVNNYEWAKLCKKNQKPYIVHPRGMSLVGHHKVFLKKLYNELMGNFIFENAAAIIALSQFEMRHFKSYPLLPSQIRVIPNGITVPTINKDSSPTQSLYFLYLGRLEHRKNLLFLIDAFHEFIKLTPGYHLKLRGPVEKNYTSLVKQKIESLGLQNSVHILPPLYDEKKWLEIHESQAVIYPSLEEAFGRVPFEAIASKTYTVVPKESGSYEYLEKILPDCHFDLGSQKSLTNALIRISKKSKSSTELEKAFTWVKQELNWEKIGGTVLDLYSHSVG